MILLALAVVASGCAHSGKLDKPGKAAESPGKGLKVKEFSISDQELGPRQRGIITVVLENYHEKDIELQEVSLYNTAFLEVSKEECVPGEIRSFRAGQPGRMECTWTVEVPDSSVEGFRDKIVPAKLNVAYSSQLTNNRQPLKLTYKPLQQIESTKEFTRTYSNNEIEMSVTSEKPAPSEGRMLEFAISNVGKGRVDGNLKIDYSPPELFNCPSQKELVGGKTEFSCQTSLDTDGRTTRNLIFSISYKYVKAPTLDIRVVDQ